MSDKSKPRLMAPVPLSEIAQLLLRIAVTFEEAGSLVRAFAHHRDANALEAHALRTRESLHIHELLMTLQDRVEQAEDRLTRLEQQREARQ